MSTAHKPEPLIPLATPSERLMHTLSLLASAVKCDQAWQTGGDGDSVAYAEMIRVLAHHGYEVGMSIPIYLDKLRAVALESLASLGTIPPEAAAEGVTTVVQWGQAEKAIADSHPNLCNFTFAYRLSGIEAANVIGGVGPAARGSALLAFLFRVMSGYAPREAFDSVRWP